MYTNRIVVAPSRAVSQTFLLGTHFLSMTNHRAQQCGAGSKNPIHFPVEILIKSHYVVTIQCILTTGRVIVQ